MSACRSLHASGPLWKVTELTCEAISLDGPCSVVTSQHRGIRPRTARPRRGCSGPRGRGSNSRMARRAQQLRGHLQAVSISSSLRLAIPGIPGLKSSTPSPHLNTTPAASCPMMQSPSNTKDPILPVFQKCTSDLPYHQPSFLHRQPREDVPADSRRLDVQQHLTRSRGVDWRFDSFELMIRRHLQ